MGQAMLPGTWELDTVYKMQSGTTKTVYKSQNLFLRTPPMLGRVTTATKVSVLQLLYAHGYNR